MRVLVVEDDAGFIEPLLFGLRRHGIDVDWAPDGRIALDLAGRSHYDVVLLDRRLPGMTGDEVCKELRARGDNARILMLSAMGMEWDIEYGLDIGADDYVCKPYSLRELIARLHALTRRNYASQVTLQVGDLIVDRKRRLATRGSSPLNLTAREFSVLELLVLADGAPVSAERLLDCVWGSDASPFSQAVSITMSRLRKHIGQPPLIFTKRREGYYVRA